MAQIGFHKHSLALGEWAEKATPIALCRTQQLSEAPAWGRERPLSSSHSKRSNTIGMVRISQQKRAEDLVGQCTWTRDPQTPKSDIRSRPAHPRKILLLPVKYVDGKLVSHLFIIRSQIQHCRMITAKMKLKGTLDGSRTKHTAIRASRWVTWVSLGSPVWGWTVKVNLEMLKEPHVT